VEGSAPLITKVEDIGWESRLAARTRRMQSSVIRELLKLTVQPEIISFAGGLPAPEFFPVREFQEACHFVLETNGPAALQYSPTEGHRPLKEYLAEAMSKYGIQVELDNILLVHGSQQGLDLIGKLFIDTDACILTSRPTYLGALQAWNAYEAQYCTVPMDDDGMLVDEIPGLLRAGNIPRLVYVLPNFHNPAGTTLSFERRKRLAEIAREHDLIIVEDDPYGELRFEGEDITPLWTLAPERTLYLSTFSKTLAPGIRLAWVVAPKTIIGRLVQAKQGADLHTGTFLQMVANDICQRGFVRQHVRRLRAAYRARRDAMVEAMEEHFPEGAAWTVPQGGLFLWVRAPGAINTREFLKRAVQSKVAYVPGFAFYPGEEGGEHTMRMNFSYSSEEVINEGIARLGRAMKEELANRRGA
jgi:2-aminoadipate transaminase